MRYHRMTAEELLHEARLDDHSPLLQALAAKLESYHDRLAALREEYAEEAAAVDFYPE